MASSKAPVRMHTMSIYIEQDKANRHGVSFDVIECDDGKKTLHFEFDTVPGPVLDQKLIDNLKQREVDALNDLVCIKLCQFRLNDMIENS